jgi:hypothetical protein
MEFPSGNPKTVLPLSPRKLISFWDMIEILPKDFPEVWRRLDAALTFCAPLASFDNKPPRSETASPAQQKELAGLLTDLWNTCKKWNLSQSLFIVNEAREWLVDPARHATRDTAGAYKFPKEIPPTDFNSIYKQLVSIRQILHEELYSIRFALVPSGNVHFFQHPALFGESVNKAFPDAYTDIMDAGNCLAVGLGTAAVFHLMRTVELGLRALARDLQVAIPEEDLEYKQWEVIIEQIRGAVKSKTICAGRSDKDKSEIREFYNGLLLEFEGFKHIWRNNAIHARRSYTTQEAELALVQVRGFMQRLATKVSEIK